MADGIGWIGCGAMGTDSLDPALYGAKAHWLARAAAMGLPVPPAFAISAAQTVALVRAISDGSGVEMIAPCIAALEEAAGARLGDPERPLLLAMRPSAPGGAGGTAPAILNIGVSGTTLPALETSLGARTARDLHRRLLQSYGSGALGVDGEEFEYALFDHMKDVGADAETELSAAEVEMLTGIYLRLIEDEGSGSFPDDAMGQVLGAAAAMASAWETPRARMRRTARGFEADAPLALIVQVMALGLGPAPSGAGVARLRDEATGAASLSGRYLDQAQGDEALMGLRTPLLLTNAEGPGPALTDSAPGAAVEIERAVERIEMAFGEAFEVHFTLEAGRLSILELAPARRSPRAALRIAVELAEAGAISREDALVRVDPAFLDDHLHPNIDPDARRDLIGQGLPASPGAAAGGLVFSSDAAETARAEGRAVILALIETSPEDIRGMHAASGVLTVRGGMTSHAAVVARGLGRPCVVGAKTLTLDRVKGVLRAADGRVFREGDAVTVVGSDGGVLAGSAPMIEPEITGAFATLMDWADDVRRMGVRANADTTDDAATARGFNAGGIGLCRTEHMFFKRGRLTPMRQMIMADSPEVRSEALERLRPVQTGDFTKLFEEMAGLPIVIRLLDPPLHEFLPHGEDEMADMAAEIDVPVSKIRARAAELAEFNPMLGKRGCRIGIAFPEIYAMQARAIFDAAVDAGRRTGQPVRPEIMVPLVSAVRELEVLAGVIEKEAEAVRNGRGEMVEYTIGVMIETPRACLRAGDFSQVSDFLSFGTNDLTQMIYGLSRDDAGRFMPDYVNQGVYDHDPFHQLDMVGVGEMLRIATERARAVQPGISIGLCGEHGGDPASIAFCDRAGFDYVSCSPYRVPIARLAAAQAAIRFRRETLTDIN